MDGKKWRSLTKVRGSYVLDPEVRNNHRCGRTAPTGQFRQVAFDDTGERLLAADINGTVTYVELGPYMRRCTLGMIQSCTFLAFNPLEINEILIGSNDGTITILRLDRNIKDYCSLTSHKLPVRHASFFKGYALTASASEVILWNLSSCCKLHQLGFSTTNVNIHKASISFQGLIVTLYHDSTIQIWQYPKLDQDIKLDIKSFGLRDVRDFDFTKDGRAMILGGLQNRIVILNTFDWNLIKRIELPNGFIGIRQLNVLPQALDGGANKLSVILASDGKMHFLDLNICQFVSPSSDETLTGISKIAVSPNGRYITRLEVDGRLRLNVVDTLVSQKPKTREKAKDPVRSRAHTTANHLSCVRQYIKEELKLERLLPILKEFGEYPAKYRSLIWATVLEIPQNRNAYSALANQNLHKGLSERILSNYPIADKTKAAFLTTIMNCLVHWCSMLSQSLFLPRLIFPFLMVYQGNHLVAFEIIIFVLYNYCQRWFEYHPLPPLNVLAAAENVLSEADPALLNFFCAKGVTTSVYVWPLLQSMLSEVLADKDWLVLWDHLFSSGQPILLLMCALAYSVCSREAIMSRLNFSEDFERFYHSQGHVRIVDLLKVARRIDQSTSHHLHPSRYFRNKICLLPKTGPYPGFLDDQYPKFLTSDSQAQLEKLRERDEWELDAQRRNLQKMKQEEEKRLHLEREHFLKEINTARVNEMRACYLSEIVNDQIYSRSAQNVIRYKETDRDNSRNGTSSRTRPDNSCKHLQNQVQQLELEVQTLLQGLDSTGTTKTTI